MDLSITKELAAVKPHVACLADNVAVFNNLNLQYQGDVINIINSKYPYLLIHTTSTYILVINTTSLQSKYWTKLFLSIFVP